MSAAALPHGSRIARLSSWLGGNTGAAPALLPDDDAAPADVNDRFSVARREGARALYAQIGEFLDTHDLAPTIEHFRIARCYVLGEDSRITRIIDLQLADQSRIDAAFLEQLTARVAPDPLHPDRIAKIADALAARLADSETTFRQSHISASDYTKALVAEVDAAAGNPDATVQRLLAVTTEAIGRTRELSDRLRRTHRETEQLRGDLQEAQRAAEEDHLTGLPNRRCFDGRLHALAAAGSHHCVALCDLDNFKMINDRHGHDTGDRVLKLIARHLTTELGGKVLVARHGGEEFACLFEHCTPEQARAQLDDARDTLAGRSLVNQTSGEGIGRLTFSGGVAILDADPSAAMRAADAALYVAKREGKDRIVIAPS